MDFLAFTNLLLLGQSNLIDHYIFEKFAYFEKFNKIIQAHYSLIRILLSLPGVRMFNLVFVRFVIEKLDLSNFFLALLDKNSACFDHVLARREYFLNFSKVELFDSF